MSTRWGIPYFLVVLIWGSAYLVTDVALQSFSPGQIAMWRALIGAGFGATVLIIGGSHLPRLAVRDATRILLLAGLTTTACICAAAAQQRMPSGAVAVICATTPLLSIALSRMTGAATPKMGWLGVGLGVVGVAVLLNPGAELDQFAVLLGLISAVCLALAGVLAAMFFSSSPLTATQLTTVQLLASGGGVAVLPSLRDAPSYICPRAALALLVLGILQAGLANMLFWRVIRQAGPAIAATTYQVVPVVAVLLGAFVLDESVAFGEVLGGTLVFAGLGVLRLGSCVKAGTPRRRGSMPPAASRSLASPGRPQSVHMTQKSTI